MSGKGFNDDQLGRLLSLVVGLLVLCIIYLVILLPFSSRPDVTAGAIGALGTLVGTLVSVRAWKR